MTLACRSDPVPMLVTGAIVGAGVEKKLEKPRMSMHVLGADETPTPQVTMHVGYIEGRM